MIYITFDEFYGVDNYNSFINSAKNNGIEFTEWINIRPPYNWYIGLESMNDLPKFVDFEIATDQQERYMIKKIDSLMPKDDYLLLRRETDNKKKFDKFVMNDYLSECYDKKSLVLFRYKNKEELRSMSKLPEMKDTKIYDLGRIRNWNLAITSNQFVKGLIISDYDLYSTTKSSDFKVGEIEAYINYYIIRTEKIADKKYRTEYWMNGKVHPVTQSS